MAFEITGKVIDISPVQQVSDKFRKREFVIESTEKSADGRDFTDYIKFQCVQDRCDLLNESFLNEVVKISFNIKGNRWEKDGRVNYFTNLDAWKIEKAAGDVSGADDVQDVPFPGEPPADTDDFDDLPF